MSSFSSAHKKTNSSQDSTFFYLAVKIKLYPRAWDVEAVKFITERLTYFNIRNQYTFLELFFIYFEVLSQI